MDIYIYICTYTTTKKKNPKQKRNGHQGRKKNKKKSTLNERQNTTKQNPIVMTIMIISVPFPKSTTNLQIHHFKTTFMCPRSIATVLFESVRRFRAPYYSEWSRKSFSKFGFAT